MSPPADVADQPQQQPRRRLPGLAAILPVLLPFLILVGTGLYGLDFGYHWDEERLFDAVDWSLANGILLPNGFYQYPSVPYWLSLASVIPEVLPALQDGRLSSLASNQPTGAVDRMRSALQGHSYHQRTRGLFLVISSLSVVWVYLAQLACRRHWLEALLAALILGTSWEVAYHLRWIAPDGIMAQFGALTILLAMLAWLRPSNWVWLPLAAVAAGLAVGTKYPAGLLLIPVMLAAYFSQVRTSHRLGLTQLLFGVFFLFALSYLVSTPGTLLEPKRFVEDIIFEISHYRTGHVGHTTAAGFTHLWLNVVYFSLALFSRYETIAVLSFLFSVLGAYAVYRESPRTALLLLSFPLLYTLYMSQQRVMITRNLLVVAPFLAILSARGIALVWRLLQHKSLRMGFAVLVSGMLVVNAAWLGYAAETIRHRNSERFIQEMTAYIDTHPQSRFYLSDQVWMALDTLNGSQLPSNITRDPLDRADKALFYVSEGMMPSEWPATRRKLTTTWFGPWEVNINYYPNWEGDDRIMLMTMPQAQEIGVRALLN